MTMRMTLDEHQKIADGLAEKYMVLARKLPEHEIIFVLIPFRAAEDDEELHTALAEAAAGGAVGAMTDELTHRGLDG
jgi:hypothetical protein